MHPACESGDVGLNAGEVAGFFFSQTFLTDEGPTLIIWNVPQPA